jgi:DNA-binding response OmpR family regulator
MTVRPHAWQYAHVAADWEGKRAMKATILIVDDRPDTVCAFAKVLEDDGYEVLPIAADELDARYFLDEHQPDLVILDIQFGNEQRKGFDILKAIREKDKTIPIIMLTELLDERLDPLSYNLDADHFVSKLWKTETLLARVRRCLRRDRPEIEIVDDRLEIDRGSRSVKKAKDAVWSRVHLQPKEFDVLEHLLSNAGQVITREILYARFFQDATDPANSLNRCIRELRRKLEPDPANPRYIVTTRGVGYCFED